MTTTVAAPAAPTRIASVDVIRGAVMVLMAIDHVRVYAGVPAGGPDPAIFFTRWITHFCAPAFIFLAGTSAFLYARTHAGVSRFLLTRGAWLVLLELTVLRIAWTFNLEFARYNMAGVIWVIGWSMILLALLVRLPLAIVGAFGIVMIAGHNLLEYPSPASALWKILYVGFFEGPISAGDNGPVLWVLYSIVPWVGVMAAGYAFGAILMLDDERRRRICLSIGLGAIALFLVLRGFNIYGNPQPWTPPDVLSFLNTAKYPASLQFLLMTLGPTIALIPLLERPGAVARLLTVFGRVPFFFYVLHIPLIHVLAIAVSVARTGAVDPWLFADHPMGTPPPPDGLHVEPAAAVRGVGRGHRDPLFRVPLVRGAEGAAPRLVAAIPVGGMSHRLQSHKPPSLRRRLRCGMLMPSRQIPRVSNDVPCRGRRSDRSMQRQPWESDANLQFRIG